MVFLWLGAAEVESFDYNHSFEILFMVILGGLGSLLGCFLGAAIIWIMPVFIRACLPPLVDTITPWAINSAQADLVSDVIIGILIVVFLIMEPHGLARLWAIIKQKLRVWPFPY